MKLQQYSQIIMGQDNTFKDQFYLVLAGIFIASLVTCNLIANKFVTVDLGFKFDGLMWQILSFYSS